MKIIIGLVAAVMLPLMLWLTGCNRSGPPVPEQGGFPTSPPASDYSTSQPALYDPATGDQGAYDPSQDGGDYGVTTDDPGFSQWESDLNQNNLDSTRCMTDASAC